MPPKTNGSSKTSKNTASERNKRKKENAKRKKQAEAAETGLLDRAAAASVLVKLSKLSLQNEAGKQITAAVKSDSSESDTFVADILNIPESLSQAIYQLVAKEAPRMHAVAFKGMYSALDPSISLLCKC